MHSLETMRKLNEEAAKREEKRNGEIFKRLAVKILYYFQIAKKGE